MTLDTDGEVNACRALAVFTAGLSAAIIVAEATIPPSIPNLSLFSLLLHRVNASTPRGDEVPTQLTTFALLAYPCMAAYYALYRLGRFSFYRLIPRHTNAYSLLANALLMCRFAAPLAFNFMAAIAIPVSKYDDFADVTETVSFPLSPPPPPPPILPVRKYDDFADATEMGEVPLFHHPPWGPPPPSLLSCI